MKNSLQVISTLTAELVRQAGQYGLSDASRHAIELACAHVHQAGYCVPADWLDVIGVKHHSSVACYKLFALRAWVEVSPATAGASLEQFENRWEWIGEPHLNEITGIIGGAVRLALAEPVVCNSLADIELEADRLFVAPVVGDGFELVSAKPIRPEYGIERGQLEQAS